MGKDIVELLLACVVSLAIGSGTTFLVLNKKIRKLEAQALSSIAPNTTYEKTEPEAANNSAVKENSPVAQASSGEEAIDSGLTTIKMMRMDPESFINKTAKLYVKIQPSDYYNYGYRDARDSHFAFKACEGDGYSKDCANFYIVKTKGRELLQKAMAAQESKYLSPVTLIVSNLKFRHSGNSSEHFEFLDYRFGEDHSLLATGYTAPDYLSQMAVAISKVETRWQANNQARGGVLWVPVVRLYFKNQGEKAISNLNLEGKFVEVASNESFGTGSEGLGYNETLEPGQSRFIDVSSSIGYKNSPPYPVPVIKADLILNKSELGAVTFSGSELTVSTVKVAPLETVASEKVPPADNRTPASNGP